MELKRADRSHSLIIIYDVLHVPFFITNLISIFLLCKKKIYWCSDNYILRRINDQSKVIVGQLMRSLFILSTIDLLEFALFSQSSNVNKPDIKILYYQLGHLHIDNIIKLVFISTRLEMPDSIIQSQLFYWTYIFAKQVKHISKSPVTRAKTPREIIHTDLVGPITPTGYDGSKYGLLLTDDATRATAEILLREKSKVKVELPRYTARLQMQHVITVQGF